MFELQKNDPALMCIAGLIFQFCFFVVECLEERKLIPGFLSKTRAQFRDNPVRWLITGAPLTLLALCGLWLGLRQLPIETIDTPVLVCIIISFYGTSMLISIFKWHKSKLEIQQHTQAAHAYIKQAEHELETLEQGPAIEDEDLDRTILNAKLKLAKAREILGVKKDDPNDR